jgi:hypothetical protein
LKSKEYFKFVVSKIENDLKIYSSSGELLKCLYLLSILKNSDNPLKDIYTISRIKNFKSLGNYLLFVLKKTETGEVRFDNLLENLILDKDFILTELLNRFDIDRSPESALIEKPKIEEPAEEEITGEIRRILAESRFKVEEIDNELVTEEFIESEVKEDNDLIVRGNYLELLQPEGGFEEESVFSLPTNKAKQEEDNTDDLIENDVFSLPGDKIAEETTYEESIKEPVNTEELEEVKLNEPVNKETEELTETVEEIQENISEALIKTPEAGQEEEELTEELIPEEEEAEIPNEIIPEEADEEVVEETKEEITKEVKEEVVEEDVEEVVKEDVKEVVEEVREEIREEEKETEEISEEAGTIEVENSFYMQYETELFSRNEWLNACFDEIKGLTSSQDNFEERREALIKEITDNSAYMEEYSQKMSFEVITGIYNVMNMTFSSYGKTVGTEILGLFKNSISLVESLIKGEDFAGFDNIIKSLEMLKNTLIDSRKEDLKAETAAEKETDELEAYMITKQYDKSDRQKLSQIKQNILDIETVFKSLEDIKGKFQAYEALRRLSHTFAHLKELVSVANTLEMRKLSQLAEASYIFIKFIQNYRMNPFESDITEVFKYIIYNFKLIFLDKPTKDIDLLISYLNDPVKIFEKKEKK